MKPYLLLLATALYADPVLQHPNSLVSFPAPEIKDTLPLDLEMLKKQNPQYEVYFDGGIVGLFGRVPEAPIWTTIGTGWQAGEMLYVERIIPQVPDKPTHPHWPPPPPPPPPYCPPDQPEGPDGPAVPEPATGIMFVAGLAFIAAGVNWGRR